MSEHLSADGVPHLVLERAPHRRAVALRAVGLPGRERARLARPLPWPGVRRPRPRRFRLQGAGRGLLRRLRGEDRGADPVRRRGDVGAQERRCARLPRGDVGRSHRRALRRGRDRPVPAPGDPGDHSRRAPGLAAASTPAAYRNPGQLPDGAVLVVGAGSSGVQIADELCEAGRHGLPLGRPARPAAAEVPRARLRVVARRPRQVGRRDPPAGAEHVTIAVSGAHGGHTVDFRDLAAQRHQARRPGHFVRHGGVRFAPDLGDNIARRRRQLPVAARRGRRLRRRATASTSPRSRRPASWARTRSA